MSGIIGKAIDAQEFDLAANCAISRLDGWRRESILVEITNALIIAGRLDDAEQLMASLPDLRRKAQTVLIATAAAKTGDIDRALRLVDANSDQVRRIEPLVDAARSAHSADNFKLKFELIREIEFRGRACTDRHSLARALALLITAVPLTETPGLIAEVLAIGGWEELLDTLAEIGLGDLLSELAGLYLQLT